MTTRPTKARDLLWRTLALCAGARWRSLEALQVPVGSSRALRDLVRRIQTRARRRWGHPSLCEPEAMESDVGDGSIALQVELAFHHLQLAEQRLLLRDEDAGRQHCRGFLNGLLAAAFDVLGERFDRVEQDLILASLQHLPKRLAAQQELRHTIQSGDFPDRLIFVLGMHRSGTSALSGLLCQAGFDPPADLMPPHHNNPLGYWESLGLCRLNDAFFSQQKAAWNHPEFLRIGWENDTHTESWRRSVLAHLQAVFAGAKNAVIKDPRFCILLEGISPWLESGWIAPCMLLAIRDPLEVARSLEAAEHVPLEQGVQLWLHYVFGAESISRGHPRLAIHYRDLLRDPEECLERCRQLIGSQGSTADPSAGLAFVTPDLYQQRRSEWANPIRLDSRTSASTLDLAMAVFSLLQEPDLNRAETLAGLDNLLAHWQLLPETTGISA